MGIGLCRTERMFNDPERLPIVIEMIVAENKLQHQEALNRLLPIQRADFKGLFEVMSPRKVTIRLLDPPIHEFLPSEPQLQKEIEQLQYLHEMAAGASVLCNTMNLLESGEGCRVTDKVPLPTMVNPDLVEEVIIKKQSMLKKVRVLYETNPMLGHRGVRLGITFPEIYSMQIRAILEAATECVAKGMEVYPQIMIPQVSTVQELKFIKNVQ